MPEDEATEVVPALKTDPGVKPGVSLENTSLYDDPAVPRPGNGLGRPNADVNAKENAVPTPDKIEGVRTLPSDAMIAYA
jgi:hypothetical protein